MRLGQLGWTARDRAAGRTRELGRGAVVGLERVKKARLDACSGRFGLPFWFGLPCIKGSGGFWVQAGLDQGLDLRRVTG